MWFAEYIVSFRLHLLEAETHWLTVHSIKLSYPKIFGQFAVAQLILPGMSFSQRRWMRRE